MPKSRSAKCLSNGTTKSKHPEGKMHKDKGESARHERTEGKAERRREYGKKPTGKPSR